MSGRVSVSRIESGPLPKQRSVESLFPGKVIDIDRPPRDENVNDRIQREGAVLGHSGEPYTVVESKEQSWYRKHKGYSDKIQAAIPNREA